MRALLAHYYIRSYSYKNTDLIIMCLLHELRIMTVKQLFLLLNTEYEISLQNVQKRVGLLTKHELVGRIRSDVDRKTYCYYLTKVGHNNIGGMYSFPKVPEYNLNHHLMVTNALIDTLYIVKTNPHLRVIQTERRQAYEIKDFNKEMRGRVFNVADFLFRFQSENGRDVNWYFEIELTSKTKRRYMNGIFPKYIKNLERNYDAHLFYVTPSNYIFDELKRYKKYFVSKFGQEKESIFQRLHVIPSTRFQTEITKIVESDQHINW
jgi:hypothetical protein